MLLMYAPSRNLFNNAWPVDLLLRQIAPGQPTQTTQTSIEVLMASMLDNPHSTRQFEARDGLARISTLLRSEPDIAIASAIRDLLDLYALPERPSDPEGSQHPHLQSIVEEPSNPWSSRRSAAEKRLLITRHIGDLPEYFVNNAGSLPQDVS